MKDFPFPSQDQNQDGQVDTEEFLEWASWRKGLGNGARFATSGWCYKCFFFGGGVELCVGCWKGDFFFESHLLLEQFVQNPLRTVMNLIIQSSNLGLRKKNQRLVGLFLVFKLGSILKLHKRRFKRCSLLVDWCSRECLWLI